MSGNTGPSGTGSGNQGGSSRTFDGPSNANNSSATPSSFSFEPSSIFDWASSHHTQQHSTQRSNNSPYYPHPGQPPAHSLDLVNALGGGGSGGGSGTIHPSSTQQNIASASNNTAIGNRSDQNDDDDDDDEEGNGSAEESAVQPQPGVGRKRVRGSGVTHRLNRKGGGRPRDFIWAYFDERLAPNPTADTAGAMRHSATCKACGWSCEQPKAFRMRQHVILNCELLPDEEKERVLAIQNQKDAAAEERKSAHKRSQSQGGDDLDNSVLVGLNNGSGRNSNSDINTTFGDVFGRLSATHPSGSGSAEPSYFSYTSLGGAPSGADGSSLVAGPSVLAQANSGDSKLNGNAYKNGVSGANSKKKRRKDESASNGVNTWNLNSFLTMAPGKMSKSPITCHVLDSSAGRPGASIKIRMDQLSQTGFMHVATGETDSDGRNNSLLSASTPIEKNSIYKMTFYTREYFSAKGVDSFYPFVEVVFEIKEPDEHHHIALLLSPFSYTTYRGS